jgi:transposase
MVGLDLAENVLQVHGIPDCGLEKLGHEARTMPAAYMRPYVKRNKNDERDAESVAVPLEIRP